MGADLLITIAHILTTEADLTEALRLVVREVVRFVGAETGAAYRVDRARRVFVPVAAYRVPKHALEILMAAVVPIDEQGFRESVFAGASVTSSDDVQNDPRFAFELFHRFPHRSAVIVPFHVNAEDRERAHRARDAAGVTRDFHVELRTNDGGTVWARMNARALRDGDHEYLEGTIEDITNHRRAEEAERRAETLRAVAQLANAAAHEINNPLAVIVGRLEPLRRELTPEQQGRLAQVVDASRQIAKIIAHMGRLTRLETLDDLPASPMLDLQRSSETPKP